jgi:predicted dehydrogenase
VNREPRPPQPLKVGLIGVGHLGTYHLNKYRDHPLVASILIHDIDLERARQRAGEGPVGGRPVRVVEDPAEVLAECEAVSIAVPTSGHHEVVLRALAAGCHVLVEKPIASTAAQAGELVAAAGRAGVLLQVGHVERFNPALQGLEAEGVVPGFIEAHRLATYNPRGRDVSVVHDLMVHDLDLVLHLVGEQPADMQAAGVAVIGPTVDIANVRLRFPGGCVANLTASRVSLSPMRKLRIFQKDAYLSLDLQAGRREMVRLREGTGSTGEAERTIMQMAGRQVTLNTFQGSRDALAVEIDAFLRAVSARREGRDEEPPRGVSGAQAAAALALAESIAAAISSP